MKKNLNFIFVFLLGVFCIQGVQASSEAMAQDAFSNPNEFVSTGVTGGGLAPVAEKFDAGSVPFGSSTQVIVRFKNNDGQEISFRDIKLFPSSNVTAEISNDACSQEPLPSGAECALVLSVKGLQRGAFRIELLVSHSGRSRLVTTTVNGTVDVDAADKSQVGKDIVVDPSPIEFGSLNASRSLIRSVILRNITSKELTITGMRIEASEQSGFSLRSECKTLFAGQACVASIIWSPKFEGPSSGSLIVDHSGASRSSITPVSGTFTPTEGVQAKIFPTVVPGKGLLVSSETQVNFETVSSESSITISLVNVGDNPLTLGKISMANKQQGLVIHTDGCKEKLVMKSTDACGLTLTWTPTRDGSIIDDLRIEHDGARGILVIPVRGTATEVQSIDSRPLMVVGDRVNSAPISGDDTTGDEQQNQRVSSSAMERARTLDSYKVTSLSKDKAVIAGPGGSRIVRDNSTIRLGGELWQTFIKPEGILMKVGGNELMLVFDRSFGIPDPSTAQANVTSDSSSSTPQLQQNTPAPTPLQVPLVPTTPINQGQTNE